MSLTWRSAVVLGADDLQYSADFVGTMASTVEAAFDHAPLCFFLQGGDGDINPYYAATPLSDDAIAKRDWTGKQLGNEVVGMAKTIHPEVPREPEIDFADDVMSLPLRWNPHTLRAGLLDAYGPKVFEDHADLLAHDPPPDHLDLHVTALLLNRRIALIGMPGEPFVNFKIKLERSMPAQGCCSSATPTVISITSRRLRPQPKAATGQPIPIHTCKSGRARGWSGKASRGCTRCWEGFVILQKKNSRKERTRYPGGKVRHKVVAAV
jgi:hypothetical protein